MEEAKDIYGSIYRNLIDTGCDQQMIERCMTFVKEGQFSDIGRYLPDIEGLCLVSYIRARSR